MSDIYGYSELEDLHVDWSLFPPSYEDFYNGYHIEASEGHEGHEGHDPTDYQTGYQRDVGSDSEQQLFAKIVGGYGEDALIELAEGETLLQWWWRKTWEEKEIRTSDQWNPLESLDTLGESCVYY